MQEIQPQKQVPILDVREVPESPTPQGAKALAMDKWRTQHDAGELEALASDELVLLLDYRCWAVSSDAATGVFHWSRKNAMKRLEEAHAT